MHVNSLAEKPPLVYAAILFVTLLPLYYASYQYRLIHPYGGRTPGSKRPPSIDFIRDWLNTHLVSPFNPSPISTYCNLTTWHPNLVFNLENANGGIGNVRGNVLDFLFFAIEAGASIVLPGRAARDDDNLSNVWAARASFDSFFDEEWFLHTMAQACPQMAIYKPEPDQELKGALPGNFLPRTRRMDTSQENTKKAYLEHLDSWLKGQQDFHPENLTLVNLERTLWDIDTRSLPEGFRRNFGVVLRTNPSIMRIAAIVAQNLALAYNLPLDPRDPIPKGAFFGAHLRTESDAVSAGWLNEAHSNFSQQTDAYISLALKHDLQTIYVASGNQSDVDEFKAKAAAHIPPLTVTSKYDLLPPQEAALLREFLWDEQAIVDYEVLQRSSVFGGIVKSSFSYNIAMSRNQRLQDLGHVMDPWFVLHQEEGVAFDDGISRILGRDEWHEGRIPRGMWP